MTDGGAWIIIPAKSFALAKQRLSSLMSDSERATLARVMLADVLGAAAATSGPHNIAVVTSSDDVARDAIHLGALVIDDGGASGTNDAIKAGLAAVAGRGGHSVVLLPGDVPAVLSDDISGLLAAVEGEGEGVAIAPATRDGGTNALAMSQPGQLEPCFGVQSFARHVRAANQLGIKPRIVQSARLGLDIDEPCDLFQFLAQKTSTATDSYLRSVGVLERQRAASPFAMTDTSMQDQDPRFVRPAMWHPSLHK